MSLLPTHDPVLPPEEEPLLPQFRTQEESSKQHELHKKLHLYQCYLGLKKGYMPTTEQIVKHLDWMVQQDALNPYNTGLSPDGKKLIELTRTLIDDIASCIKEKNDGDYLQEALWELRHAPGTDSVNVRVHGLNGAVANGVGANVKAQKNAAQSSIKTIFNLFMSNSEFRNLFQDANLVLHQILSDTLSKASEVTGTAADHLKPTTPPSKVTDLDQADKVEDQLPEPTEEITDIVADGAAQTADAVVESVKDNLLESDNTKNMLRDRVRKAVTQIKTADVNYEKSVSTLAQVLKTYISNYATTLEQAADTNLGVEVKVDDTLHHAYDHLFTFVQQFGDKKEWEATKKIWDSLLRKLYKGKKSVTTNVTEQTEGWADGLVDLLQKLLTDPDYIFSDDQKEQFNEKFEAASDTKGLENVKDEMVKFGEHLVRLTKSIMNDKTVTKVAKTASKISDVLIAPSQSDALWINPNIKDDFLQVILPSLFTLIQFLPIPRLELATPDAALLLSTLVLEPGAPPTTTAFSSNPATTPSFFPERIRLETYSDIDIVRRSRRPLPPTKLTFTAETLSLRADEFGYRLLLKPNPSYDPRAYHRPSRGLFETQGLASFAIDKGGLDVSLTVDVSKNSLENLVSLNKAKVNVHNLTWKLHPTPFKKIRPRNKAINAALYPISFVWKLIKYILLLPIFYIILKPLIITPLLKLFIRKSLERSIEQTIHAANTELVFARERLRAVKIAKPDSWIAWGKALAARWEASDDEDQVQIGMTGQVDVWKGVRGVGGLDAIWEEQGLAAGSRVREQRVGGWKNEIFDIVG